MTKTAICYFSATGNSLSVAKSLAEKLNAKLTPIVPKLKEEAVETDADAIGLVFPLYDFKAPPFVENFAKKLGNLGSKYIFAVATYGFMPQKAMKKFDQTLQACGGKLSGGFVVSMPNNGIVTEELTAKREKKMREEWSKKLEEIAEYVTARKEGKIETGNVATHLIFNGLIFKVTPKLLKIGIHVARHGWQSLAFVSDGNCNACGICTQVCPVDNITLTEGKPTWGENCLHCFACLQWCPQQAIQAGTITVGNPRYHHPDLKITEIIKQKTE
ncbi:MAG: EFR1 family ferrodoxin [Candidatus Bathyarchaeia archaeon]